MQPINFIGAAVASQMAEGLDPDARRKHVLVAAFLPANVAPVHAMVVHREAVAAAHRQAAPPPAPASQERGKDTPPREAQAGEPAFEPAPEPPKDPAARQADALDRLADSATTVADAVSAYLLALQRAIDARTGGTSGGHQTTSEQSGATGGEDAGGTSGSQGQAAASDASSKKLRRA